MFAVDDNDATVAGLRPTSRNSLERWRSTWTAAGSVRSAAPRIIVALAEQLGPDGPSRPACDQPERSAGRTKKRQ